MKTLSLALLVLWSADAAVGQDRLILSNLFTDHSVLPFGRVCPVFGQAPPGEVVTVTLDSVKASAEAGPTGEFVVLLPPRGPGGPFRMEVECAGEKRTIEDVHFGEVWICSGQSNMEWMLRDTRDGEKEIAAARDSQIRLFTVPNRVARTPERTVESKWVIAAPETVAEFSAVGWFFAKAVRAEMGVAIGLIDATWGGTPIEAWMRKESFAAIPEADELVRRWDDALAGFDQEASERRHAEALARWKEASDEAAKAGRPALERPRAPRNPWESAARPASLWNGMIAPLVPAAVSGCIWYQGESNENRAHQYRHLFAGMIRDWRTAFGQGDFPFLWVQLAGFREPPTAPEDSRWAEIREAQTLALALPRTGQALAHDLGESGDIHPRNKQDVGARLAVARRLVLANSEHTTSGPMVAWCDIAAPQVALGVRGAKGPLQTADGQTPRGFSLAGEDRKFHPAQAAVSGTMILLRSDAVPRPVAVRYAWADHPLTNVVDGAGLPLAPFRSDGWPGITTRPESK